MEDCTGEKRCNDCGVLKPLVEFNRLSSARDGRQPRCRECHRARGKQHYHTNKDRYQATTRTWKATHLEQLRATKREWKLRNPESVKRSERAAWLKFRYGIGVEEYERLASVQDGVCAICGRPPDARALAVDHDHASGRIRGLLCRACNTFLGLAQHDITILHAAIRYLQAAETTDARLESD